VRKLFNLGSAILLPGLIDSHTHLLLDVTLPTEDEGSRINAGRVPGPRILASGPKLISQGAYLRNLNRTCVGSSREKRVAEHLQ